MTATRRQFVKTLFVAGQTALFGRVAAADSSLAKEPDPAALHFLALGDWGVNGAPGQARVATRMAQTAAAKGAAFVLAVGDNFYEVGVNAVDDPQWQTSFEKVYAAHALQIPWHAILGNHDYCGNCQAQIEYGRAHPRWIMPARYYTKTFSLLGGGAADFFFIDTSPFVREYRAAVPQPPAGEHDSRAYGARAALYANVAGQDTGRQLDWLKASLRNSSAEWKIVVGHHPIYSGGVHGDQPELVDQVLPILRQCGVHVYLCGHDHDLQHLQAHGIDFICSGAGGATLYALHGTPETKFARESFGFASFALDREKLETELIDDSGTTVHRITTRRGTGAV